MIIIRLEGGLGNQMFQYALGKTLSIHHKTKLKLDTSLILNRTIPNTVFRDYDLVIFNLEVETSTPNDLAELLNKGYNFIERRKIKWFHNNIIPYYYKNEYYEQEKFKYDSNVFKSRKDAYFTGYWQHINYFSNIEDILRHDFSFRHKPSKEVAELRNEILETESVALNVRRADLVYHKEANEFMGVMPFSYYEKAIDYILQNKPNVKFYIFSDDLDWCYKAFSGLKNSFIVGNEYYGHKFSDCLYLMSSCKNFIIPNSTFAWWAVWLNQNKKRLVTQPKRWVTDPLYDTSGIMFKESCLL